MKIDKGSFINDFIDKNLRQYSIPVYQRNYEWSVEQCEKLFEDIIQAHKLDRFHFTGSVVYELLKTENKIDYYIIIDGQQRLTTIYILLKALVDVAETENEKETLRPLLFNQDKFKKYNIDESSKLKLKPIKSDNNQLLLLMGGHVDRMDKASGIFRNYDLFCKLIRKALEEDVTLNIEKIYDGIEHLSCATIKLEEEEKGKEQEIFERINSTGVPLSLADKIRNFVLMADADQERLYEDYWLPTEQMLTKEQLPGFFLDYLNMKMDDFTREKDAYDDFKRLFFDNGYTNELMLQEIRRYAGQYRIFMNGDPDLGPEVNSALEGLRKLKQTTVYLFLFRVFDDYEAGIIDKAELGKVLQLLLNYSIRRLICEVGSNTLRGLYKTLYGRVFNREENKSHYYDAVVSFLTQLTSRDAIPTDEEFVLALRERNLYRKNALCKFLLVAIENQGKEKIDTNSLSIEHIMPQNRNLSKVWQTMLGENWEQIHDRYLHTLGNLTLTGYNSELGDRPFAEKKKMLTDSENPTHITILYQDVLNQDAWDEGTIKNRAVRLSDIVLRLFPIVVPETVVDFTVTDLRFQLYDATDSGNATYKVVNYYELLGEKVTINSFAAMVRSVAGKLYDLDPTIIEHMARENAKFPGWMHCAFSYDESAAKEALELKKGSGIYISTGYSAWDCISFIREMLKCYDLNIEEDFAYSARDSRPTETINRLEIAKSWCKEQSKAGKIFFDEKNSKNRYIRFTTPTLNSVLPDSEKENSAWKTRNFYFYEITKWGGKFYIQLALYCRGLSDNMKIAFSNFLELMGREGDGKQEGYYQVFYNIATVHENSEDDTEQATWEQLDAMFEEIKVFERNLLDRWNSKA